MKRICIVGVGNELMGDDGIGPYVIRKLHEMGVPDRDEGEGAQDMSVFDDYLEGENPPKQREEVLIEAIDGGTSMLRAIYVMEGFDEAIVVDAIDFEGEPGDVVTFNPDEVESTGTGISMHSFDVIETLKMMIKLDELPVDRIIVVAIQPEAVCQQDGLSESVERSYNSIIHSIAGHIR